ncbi:type II secretion system F family protein [Streptomyces sp. NBC_01750]|uniref:type II secretion system F family protein n=1 Tax=Streptomyces sp. NBC_01750 TaxID=2975928 RepID=UPI002DDC0628|nr:type II secretion system F family protein [Streptomyces sp. NBC_01750]WSD34441.1 type II secretion system F family protein [Streptomyces sp. NBC_01750]
MTAAGEPVYAAAVCAGAAAWLTVGRERGLRRARLLLAGGAPVDSPPRWSWERLLPVVRLRQEWLCLPAALVLAVLGKSVLPLAAGAVAVPLVRRRLRDRERRREQERRAEGVIAFCGAVAAELRAGLQPGQALLLAARSTEALGGAEAAVLAAARFGGDVPEALRAAAGQPGADGLAGVAVCWRVAVDSGAGLAAGLDRLETALRAEWDQRQDLRARLAGAWSTVVLLSVLPLAGLAMGWALGADPFGVLLHTAGGLVCLVVGGLLEAAGLCWAVRIVRGGEET